MPVYRVTYQTSVEITATNHAQIIEMMDDVAIQSIEEIIGPTQKGALRALIDHLSRDPLTTAAIQLGQVPPDHRRAIIEHAAANAILHEAKSPTAYARAIIAKYHENPIFPETPDDRVARGRTPAPTY